ncbi:hypothetical protein T12_15004 [Trichinella patagoniensis]|uniref:Uncharacterized protein n=1 Tax=Trichinella patagoniensis TaxID=990121 RepID=A0A0V0Z7L4_9BILA|nr:hypothetical protein T12_15004 [Trichinella patagoniensis]
MGWSDGVGGREVGNFLQITKIPVLPEALNSSMRDAICQEGQVRN